jgi:hypothetical protein
MNMVEEPVYWLEPDNSVPLSLPEKKLKRQRAEQIIFLS